MDNVTSEASAKGPATTELRLASADGPVTRTILQTPLRDALPEEIPIIDISPLFSESLKGRQAVARQIHEAAINTGFFYVANHGVPSSVVNAAQKCALQFFHQDTDHKMISHSHKSSVLSGYRAPKSQMLNPDEGIDVREAFGWRYDPRDDPDVKSLNDIPPDITEFFRYDDFPWETTTHLPGFRETNLQYFQALLALARTLTRAFALSLDLPEDFFDSKVQYPDSAISMNYYPPIANNAALNQETSGNPTHVSIGSHTDFQFFTILWQDLNGGLQVLTREGQWLNAVPKEGTFVVNIADYMQRITNDKYVSTVHRVQNWSGVERVSIPFFWGFGSHESCGVLDKCVGEGEVKKYEEIRCHEWVEKRLGNMLKLSGAEGIKATY